MGFLGAHTVAPSSIMAWLKSPGLEAECSSNASATARTAEAALVPLLAASPPPRAQESLVATRMTFPSTAATLSPNAMEATAAAVYGPTPGTLDRAFDVRGKCPSFFVATCLAPSSRKRARR